MVVNRHVGLRTLANRWLKDTCTIRRATGTYDGDGNSESFADLATNVVCSLQRYDAAPTEAVGPRGGVMAVSTWRIRVPAGQDVKATDRIVIGSRTFEVQGVEAKTFEVRRTVYCAEINPGSQP